MEIQAIAPLNPETANNLTNRPSGSNACSIRAAQQPATEKIVAFCGTPRRLVRPSQDGASPSCPSAYMALAQPYRPEFEQDTAAVRTTKENRPPAQRRP